MFDENERFNAYKKILIMLLVILFSGSVYSVINNAIIDSNDEKDKILIKEKNTRIEGENYKKLSQLMTQALETKDMESIFDLLSTLKRTPHSNYINKYNDMKDSIFNALNDYPEFLPVIEKLAANGDYLKRSFPVLQNHFKKVNNPLIVFIAYEDDNSMYHELMQMMASTKDTTLYREIFSRTRMKIIDQFNANHTAPNIMLAKMQSLNSGINRQFPNNPDVQGWSRDSLSVIAKLVSAIDFYNESESLQKRLSEINKELEGESEHFWLSGYIEKVWRTDDKSNSETYLATVGGSSQCLLMMLGDRFTSTGSFSKKVFKYGSETVKTDGGFRKEIPIYVVLAESSLQEIEHIKNEKSSILKKLNKIEKSLGFSPTKENVLKNFCPLPDLVATVISRTDINLTWTDHYLFGGGFKIERDSGKGFSQIATTNEGTFEYTDSKLEYGASYIYRIASINPGNELDWIQSKPISITHIAPSNLTSRLIDDFTILLTWEDNCSFEAGVKIERNNGDNFIHVGEVGPDITSYRDSGLSPGTEYNYRISSFSEIDTSNWVSSGSTKTNLPAPTSLIASVLNTTDIKLTWVDNCGFESGFRLERDSGSGFNWGVEVEHDETEYIDRGLGEGRTYIYRILTYSSVSKSDFSVPTRIVTNTLPVVDIDGNIYKTVAIGTQVWMAENLKVTHYRDGMAITNMTSEGYWGGTNKGAYCYYDGQSVNTETFGAPLNVETYGALYNWYAVSNLHKIAPEGWHVPTDAEWKILIDFLGGRTAAGGKLKELGNAHWNNPNSGATNGSGFTALPGGYRSTAGSYSYNRMGEGGYFFSATEAWKGKIINYKLTSNDVALEREISPEKFGFSIRLVKD
jgi:uncharacterized protein (TIGR02145 family)